VASDSGTKVPYWGFASSPLVFDALAIVAAAGQLVAYDLATGDRRWFGAADGDGYSSPHLATSDGVAQILLMSSADQRRACRRRAALGAPVAGLLPRAPAVTDGDVLIVAGTASGAHRIAVAHGPGGCENPCRRRLLTNNCARGTINDHVIVGH
jgi:hypothetical protein